VIKRLLATDGVMAVCSFRDDGQFVEGYGLMPDAQLRSLASFAHEYKRIVQGHQDQLSMFTQIRGWTPPLGWIVRGQGLSVCSVANMVCVVENAAGHLGTIMRELQDMARS